MSCRCKNSVNKYVDVSKIDPIDWEDAPIILGMSECGNVVVVDKPLYEMTEEDRSKLDMLITNGSGNLFLSDDGTYKTFSADSVTFVTLTYDQNPVNFVLLNSDKLINIKNQLIQGIEPIVRLNILNLLVPIRCIYNISTGELLLEYDGYLYNSPLLRSTDEYIKLTVLVSLNTLTNPYTVNDFTIESKQGNYPIITNGDGTAALFNDGNYKPVYTKDGVDAKIRDEETARIEADENLQSQIDGIAETIEDAVVYNGNNDIEARNNIILNNDANLFGKTLSGGSINLIQCSRFTDEGHPIVDTGSTSAHITFNSYDRPNVQLTGESGNHLHQVAYLSELEEETNRAIQAEQQLSTEITSTQNELSALRTSTESALNSINDDLGDITERVGETESNISVNTSDIETLNQRINDTEHFRGYYATTDEVTDIPNPESGDYAYNAETGTKWIYNGTTWLNSGVPVPDQTVDAYDSVPFVNNDPGSSGTSNEYSRGDHIHPSDPTKADKTELSGYLPLSGNSQTNSMTGDIWIGQNNTIYTSDTGNSYLKTDQPSATLEIKGNGTGGIDLQSDLGSIKAKGQRIITNGTNEPSVQIGSPFIQLNSTGDGTNPVGLSLAGGTATISGVAMNGTFTNGVNMSTTGGNIVLSPSVGKLYYGSASFDTNEVAKKDDILKLDAAIDTKADKDSVYPIQTVDGLLEQKQDRLTAGEGITIDNNIISAESLSIALSDEVLTYDVAGLKANLSLEVDGSDAVLIGKDGIEIGRVNVAVGAIQNAYYDNNSNEIVIVVITSTGPSEIRIPADQLIDIYTGEGYINISNQNVVTLNYNLLRDNLINGGIAEKSDLDEFVKLSGDTMSGDLYTKNLIPGVNSNIGNYNNIYNAIYSDSIYVKKISSVDAGGNIITSSNIFPSANGNYYIGTSEMSFRGAAINNIVTSNITSPDNLNIAPTSKLYYGETNIYNEVATIRNITPSIFSNNTAIDFNTGAHTIISGTATKSGVQLIDFSTVFISSDTLLELANLSTVFIQLTIYIQVNSTTVSTNYYSIPRNGYNNSVYSRIYASLNTGDNVSIVGISTSGDLRVPANSSTQLVLI